MHFDKSSHDWEGVVLSLSGSVPIGWVVHSFVGQGIRLEPELFVFTESVFARLKVFYRFTSPNHGLRRPMFYG